MKKNMGFFNFGLLEFVWNCLVLFENNSEWWDGEGRKWRGEGGGGLGEGKKEEGKNIYIYFLKVFCYFFGP